MPIWMMSDGLEQVTNVRALEAKSWFAGFRNYFGVDLDL